MDPLLRRALARDRESTPATACPEAELLAAFADGELTDEERRAIEAHAADCSRCTEIIALTLRTAAAHAGHAPAAAPPLVQPALARWRRAYWAVPLATAATVAGLWVATSREAVAPSPPMIRAVDPVPPASRQSAPVSPQTSPAPPPAPAPAPADAAGQAAAGASRRQNANQSAISAQLESRALVDRAEQRAEAPVASPPTAPAEEPREAAAQADTRTAKTPGALAESITITGSPTFAAPGGRGAWRLQVNVIERSDDGGRTWMPEFTAPRRLTTGMALSSDIAWVGGVDGLVLRRTGGGWAVVSAPSRESITAIRAVDATTATVTLMNGRTLRTTDAGASWQ